MPLQRASFDACNEDNIVGLNARLINYWIDSLPHVENGTLSMGELEAQVERAFTRKGYAIEAAQVFIQTMKENR
jgi:hypothetical protein